MGRKIIIANWKMNKTIKEGKLYISALRKKSACKKAHIIIAASFPFFGSLTTKIKRSRFSFAAQDVSTKKGGARTGDVSAAQLKDVGCRYCIVGHSERRMYHGETDTEVNKKIKRLLEKGITPVFCFGEKEQEKKGGLTKKVIRSQLSKGLKGVKDPSKILFAYEPVWAISTFQTSKKKIAACFDDIAEAHLLVKDILTKRHGKVKEKKVKVLYGGSVTPQNAADILSIDVVDGALVGGASLKVSSFIAILKTIK